MTTSFLQNNNGAIKTYYGTGAGAIAETISPGDGYRLVSVCIHNGTAPTTVANNVITFQPEVGSAYYTLLNTQGMAGVTDLVWQPSRDLFFAANDALNIAWANADNVTYGLNVTFQNV